MICSDNSNDEDASDSGSADSEDEQDEEEDKEDAEDFQEPASKRRPRRSAYEVAVSDDQSDCSTDSPAAKRSKRQPKTKPTATAVRRQPGRAAAGKVANLAEASESEEDSASDDAMSDNPSTGSQRMSTRDRNTGRSGGSAKGQRSADRDCSMQDVASDGAVTSISDSERSSGEESDKENKPVPKRCNLRSHNTPYFWSCLLCNTPHVPTLS